MSSEQTIICWDELRVREHVQDGCAYTCEDAVLKRYRMKTNFITNILICTSESLVHECHVLRMEYFFEKITYKSQFSGETYRVISFNKPRYIQYGKTIMVFI